MTPKQILDSFSETLMQDERILSARERELLTSLLQHARTTTSAGSETHAAVNAVIASAVGETVAQRAFAVLGGSIVERILESSRPVVSNSVTMQGPGPKQPQPPHPLEAPKQPQPPHLPLPADPPKQPQPPHGPVRPADAPGPKQPQPPHGSIAHPDNGRVAVLERPAVSVAQCVVLDEFLAPQELEELTRFTLDHEIDFEASEVVSPNAEDGEIDSTHRRSRVLMDLGKHQDVVLERIKSVLPQVLNKLGMKEFPIATVEAQITASNDGDFFHGHSDNGNPLVASRRLTFVYFFHREPRQFEGGELRIHDSRMEGDYNVSSGTYQTIVPQQNQIVFFPCSLLHEITPVECPSRLFADSRFTLNGWLRQ